MRGPYIVTSAGVEVSKLAGWCIGARSTVACGRMLEGRASILCAEGGAPQFLPTKEDAECMRLKGMLAYRCVWKPACCLGTRGIAHFVQAPLSTWGVVRSVCAWKHTFQACACKHALKHVFWARAWGHGRPKHEIRFGVGTWRYSSSTWTRVLFSISNASFTVLRHARWALCLFRWSWYLFCGTSRLSLVLSFLFQ